MMIVCVTRDPRDVAAIRESGVRVTMAPTVSDGIEAASRPEVSLIVCDVAGEPGHGLLGLRHSYLPCPVVLRHDVGRQSIDALYEVARMEVDVRPSYRDYDDLGSRLSNGTPGNDINATRAILREFCGVTSQRLRDLVAVMAVMGERPVMQNAVASALGLSVSSFRVWLGEFRRCCDPVPAFPRLNAEFVALHVAWRREKLGWTAKRAAAASGFADDKACSNYLRYHLGARIGRFRRNGGFDARMTEVKNLLCVGRRERGPPVWRI